jgi:hypothetical protein
MAEVSRDEVLARYRHLRAISTHHHTEAMNFFSRPALLEQARHLGLATGEMLAAESFDELKLAFDLAIHTQGLWPDPACGRVRSRVRPLSRSMTAGPDGFRRTGPEHGCGFGKPLHRPGFPVRRLDRLPSPASALWPLGGERSGGL